MRSTHVRYIIKYVELASFQEARRKEKTMAFLGLTLGALGSAAGSGISSGLTSAASGMITGAAGGLFGGIKAKKQHKRNKEILALQNQYEQDRMKLQQQLNQQQADYTFGLEKNMWDYTFGKETEYNSPTAQVQRLKDAGLNPALMYGGSGTTGSGNGTTGGAQAAGVAALQPMGLQVALQAEMQAAQIEALKAQTFKTKAEAAEVGSQMELNKSTVGLNEIQRAKTSAEIGKINQDIKTGAEELRGKIIQNNILDETAEFEIDKAAESYRQMVMQTQKILGEAELNEKEKEILQNDIQNYERKLQILEQQADASTTSAEAAIQSARAAYKSAEALEKNAGTAENKMNSEIAKNWAGTLDAVGTTAGFIIDLLLLKKLKAAGFTLKGAYKLLQKLK